MGDFNDEPMNVAVRNVLKAGPYRHSNNDLVNMAYPLSQRGKGTYKYKNKWNIARSDYCIAFAFKIP